MKLRESSPNWKRVTIEFYLGSSAALFLGLYTLLTHEYYLFFNLFSRNRSPFVYYLIIVLLVVLQDISAYVAMQALRVGTARRLALIFILSVGSCAAIILRLCGHAGAFAALTPYSLSQTAILLEIWRVARVPGE
jgi:hypothetical protein